ncbi:MAG: protein kinase [Myxococcales bacterium]
MEDDQIVRAQARIGTVLQDKWRIDALLGVGGMASVYAATHRNQKRVALKVLHVELAGNEEVRARFLREGYTANGVGHDGAVSVLDDAVTPDGVPYLVMELLDGESIDARCERKGHRLPVAEVLQITDRLLDVLVAAHAKGIVHRDIKPDNLFLTRSGQLKVLDFGIARALEVSGYQTRDGSILGTPAFMAPEQALGHWDDIDGRTDLWAVGATMFALLSGQTVHEGKTLNEQLVFSATVPARSLATVAATLPRSVVALVDRALVYAKQDRWPSAGAMQRAVRATFAELQASMPHSSGVQSASAQADRDAAAEVLARTLPLADALRSRLEATRGRVTELEAEVSAVRSERATLDEWFRKKLGTRVEAADEARREVERRLGELGRRALSDRVVFGDGYAEVRTELTSIGQAAEQKAHEVALHEAALRSYDQASFRRGVVVIALLALVLLGGPIVWRATMTSPPPDLPKTVEPIAP